MASTAAAADSPTLGSESPASMVRKTQQPRPKPAITNFSRPRIYKTSSGNKAYQVGDSNAKSVNAYDEQDEDTDTETETDNGSIHQDRNTGEPMPSEPRFPLDDEEEPLPREPRFSTSPSLPTEARFSVETFDLQPSNSNKAGGGTSSIISRTEAFLKRTGSALLRTEYQRHPGPSIRNNSNSSGRTNDSSTSSSETQKRPETSSSTSSTKPLPPPPLKSILKQTLVQVTSERASSCGEEDTASHHTMSEIGGEGYGEDGKWHSSDYDTSGLSEKEIKKLEKKGVNPALYAEMKAARGSGKVVGALTGNTYVS